MTKEIRCAHCLVLLQTRVKDTFTQADLDEYASSYLSNPVADSEETPEGYVPIWLPCIMCDDHPTDGIVILEE